MVRARPTRPAAHSEGVSRNRLIRSLTVVYVAVTSAGQCRYVGQTYDLRRRAVSTSLFPVAGHGGRTPARPSVEGERLRGAARQS